MSDDPSIEPTDVAPDDAPLGEGRTEEEALALEAELVEQTDNGPHEDDDDVPQLED